MSGKYYSGLRLRQIRLCTSVCTETAGMNNQNIGTLSDPLDNVIFRVNQKQDQGEGWVRLRILKWTKLLHEIRETSKIAGH